MVSRRFIAFGFLTVIAIGTALAGSGLIIREDGVGPVKIGMTLPHLNTVLREKFVMPESKDDQGCFYVKSAKYSHISFMMEGGHLVRIDVDGAGIPTAEGIQVGDSEEHAKKVYGSRLKIERDQYSEDGHYLTVRSRDGRNGIRFEAEKGKIDTFYAGTIQAIQYVEGCQ
jgi:hypothetical protein